MFQAKFTGVKLFAGVQDEFTSVLDEILRVEFVSNGKIVILALGKAVAEFHAGGIEEGKGVEESGIVQEDTGAVAMAPGTGGATAFVRRNRWVGQVGFIVVDRTIVVREAGKGRIPLNTESLHWHHEAEFMEEE